MQHQIGDQRDDADQGDQDAQRGAVVFVGEEVGLRDQPVLPGVAPDRRQQPVGDDVGQAAIGQDVEHRPAMAVGVAAAAEEGEGRVDLARHQHEDQDGAEAAAADRPLLQVHVLAAPREQPQAQRAQDSAADDDERGVHGPGSVASRLAGSQR